MEVINELRRVLFYAEEGLSRLATVSSLVCGWDSNELRRVLFYAEEGLSQTRYSV